MAIKIKAGQVVRGRDFFPREKEINRLWRKIENGSNILISAPRRVGKTSLMRYIEDHPREDYIIIYLITESVSNEAEYYKRLYNKLLEEDVVTLLNKFGANTKKLLTKISEFKSLKIDHSKELDYYNEFINLIKSLELKDKKIIMMIDEFPQTLENIINEHGENKANHFLQTNRELRQNNEISEKIQFIYTGSIGLENIVSRIKSINLINDLETFYLQPLKENEAKELIKELTINLNFKLEEELVTKILEKIRWYIPYYIQILIQELNDIYHNEDLTHIDEKTIDLAFKNLLEQRIYFEHWYTRLYKAYKNEEYKFVKEVLNSICKKETFSENEVLDLAIGLGTKDKYKEIVKALIHDGYITLNDDSYRFNSPILSLWWIKNVAD